jgi:hypothetical protein
MRPVLIVRTHNAVTPSQVAVKASDAPSLVN